MPIRSTYECDLCFKKCGPNEDHVTELRAWRIKFTSKNGLQFVSLSDDSARKNVYCEKCIPAIGEAWGRIVLRDAEKPAQLPFEKEEEAA